MDLLVITNLPNLTQQILFWKKPQQCCTLKMSVLKYFKLISKALDALLEELPDVNDTFSKTMLPSAIIMANDGTLKISYIKLCFCIHGILK